MGRLNQVKDLSIHLPAQVTDLRQGGFYGASAAAGSAVKGSGLIRGFVKGWGYAEFTTRNLSGFGLDATFYQTGSITGKYLGEGLPSVDNFSGLGRTLWRHS